MFNKAALNTSNMESNLSLGSCAHREEGVCIPQAAGTGGLTLQEGMGSGSAALQGDTRQHPRHRMWLHSVCGFLLPADSQQSAPKHVKSVSWGWGRLLPHDF